jgi:hypothetical protein
VIAVITFTEVDRDSEADVDALLVLLSSNAFPFHRRVV